MSMNGYFPVIGSSPHYPCVGAERIMAKWDGNPKRCPKAGEWYLRGAIVGAYEAPNDLKTHYHIARLVVVEQIVSIVERGDVTS